MRQKATRAVVYGRNSSAKQKSIDEQLAENRAAAKANGWTVVDELDDPVSASRYATKVRKNWARLLELLPTVDVVILWEPSRGDRSLASWVSFLDRCREHKVRIHAVTHQRTYDPANARDYRSLAEDGVDSAYESDKISARVRRAKAAAYAVGRPAGKLDYGYVRVYDMTTAPPRYLRQEPHPRQSTVVAGIFDDLALGESLYAIAAKLNRDDVPTYRGGRNWRPGVVRGIATNPIYRPHPDSPQHGCLVRKGQTYVGTWPPLVTEATWQAVQRVLGTDDPTARRRRKDSAPGQVRYLLSASSQLLTAPCGSPVIGHPDRPGRSAHYLCRDDGCASVQMVEADEYLSQVVVGRLSRRDARHLWVADDTAARKAADELARLRGELDEARASFYAPGGISAVALAGKENALAPLIADAERRARPAGAPLAALKLIDAAKVGKDTVRPLWDSLPVTAKREVIGGLFSSLRLGPVTTRITRWTTPEERFAIVADRISHEWRRSPR